MACTGDFRWLPEKNEHPWTVLSGKQGQLLWMQSIWIVRLPNPLKEMQGNLLQEQTEGGCSAQNRTATGREGWLIEATTS